MLATPHGIDRYLELIHPMLAIREQRGIVTGVHRTTPDTITLRIRPSRAWRGFTAGQHVRVSVTVDGVRRTRCYSPASSQHARGFELTVKASGLVSSWLRENARPGLVLDLSPAEGDFTLPATRPDKLLLISGGSGITPVMSMLRTLTDEGHTGEVVFLHYATDEAHVPCLDTLRATGHRLVLAHTAAGSGHFTEAHLRAAAPWFAEATTYLCGPPGLMAGVTAVFDQLGIADRLRTEDFRPSTPADPGAVGRITFSRSGRTCDNTGRSLLEQAESAGLRPEHGCRMGICLSCTRRKTAGTVRDLRSGELNDEDDTEVQLCVSVPVGTVSIDL
ncbi:Ferredoxin-NADP reductase [Actinokineospora diospyrosa]|uniref:Ferredoxin-NADP reductase n=2 Tax=Actinokineospora diospyrosa TaxID=103728 RepID=A0ABT1IB24_9PSEU|nr:Ferredoxin-NADP reductase [Actinokineospora diospyrosa]